jgi:hypothetical protein
MSSPATSRPGSRAQSDVSWATAATEVPESPTAPRSTSEQIEYIKGLVSRMQGPSRQPEGAITAQLFRSRRRSGSHEPVSQTHVLSMLDSLKRRVRQEQQLLRRPSEIDPETDSENEDVDGFHGDELETIREDIRVGNAQQEEWLETAERRVDDLLGEKEQLLDQLNQRQEELDDIRSERTDLQARLEEAESRTSQLQSTLEAVQEQLKQVQAGKNATDAMYSDVNGELSVMQQLKEELTSSNHRSLAKIEELEGANDIAGQHIQRLIAEHKQRDCDAQQKLKDFQTRHDALNAENEQSKARIAQLNQEATDHEARRRDLIEQAEEHRNSLSGIQKDVELHREELSQLLKQHESSKIDAEAVRRERDEAQSKLDALLAAKESEASEAQARFDDFKKEKERSTRALTNDHDQEVGALRSQFADLQSKYDRLLKDNTDHATQLETNTHERGALEQSHRDEVEKLQKSVAEVQRISDESFSKMTAELSQLRERAEQLEQEKQAVQSELDESIANRDSATRTLETSKQDLEQQVQDLTQRASEAESQLKAREAEMNEDLSRRYADTASLRQQLSDLQQKMSDGSTEVESRERAASEQHEKRIHQLGSEWASKLDDATKKHQQHIQAMETEWLAKSEAANRSYEQRVQDIEASWSSRADEAANVYQADKQAMTENFRKRFEEHEKETNARDVTARESSATQLTKVREELQSQLDAAQKALKDGEERMETLKTQHDTATYQLRQDHEARIQEMESALNKAQEEIKQALDTQASTGGGISNELSNGVDSPMEKSLAESASKHQAEVASLRQLHDESSQDMRRKLASLEARLERTGSDHAQTLSEKEELEYRISQMKMNHEQALSRLSEEHEDMLSTARKTASQQLEEQLHVQSQAHANEFDRLQESLNNELQNLQIQLEEAAELRHSQTHAADAERERALGDLNEKLAAAGETSSALQARLDAELTSRAEVERTVAELRRQRLEDEKKASQSKEELMQQVAALQIERDAYAKRVEATSAAVKASGPRNDNTDDVTVLRSRLALVESERDEAVKAAGQSNSGNGVSELARQNEFLASQLEAMVATRSTPATPLPRGTDASVQTEPVVVKSEQEKTHARITRDAEVSTSPQDLENPGRSPSWKQEGAIRKPTDREWKSKSFEDYLQKAQAELSELGSVITQNEALFAQKIQEHVGDLQRAKDQLAEEYKEKFDALLADREKMERDVSTKGAEDFAKDRQQLVAQYSAHETEPAKQAAAITNLSSPQKQALRTAEERLVSKYNQQINTRKSQIALKHAEDFQNLTQDYDRRLADLLGSRNKLESDLSVEPGRFEQDLGELEAESLRLESDRANSLKGVPHVEQSIVGAVEGAQSVGLPQRERPAVAIPQKSQLPKRSLTSTPRTPTSIPKAVPFAGRRTSMDQQNKRQTSTDMSRSGAGRFSHIQHQANESIAQDQVEELPTARGHSALRSSRRFSSQILRGSAAQDFAIEPAEFEKQDMSRIPPATPRSVANKRRSLRLSSGIMYAGWEPPKEA